MKKLSICTLLFAASALFTTPAYAEEEVFDDATDVDTTVRTPAVEASSERLWTYPKAIAARPLTMQRGMVRAGFSVLFRGIDNGNRSVMSAFGLGAAYGVLDRLEVGVSAYRLGANRTRFGQDLLPLIAAPDFDFGDIPIWARFAWLKKENWHAALEFVAILPSNTEFAAVIAVPLRYTDGYRFAVDSGLEATILTNSGGLDLEIPLKFTFNITRQLFVEGATGIVFTELGRDFGFPHNGLGIQDRNGVAIPLIGGIGFTMRAADALLIDFITQMGFQQLLNVSGQGVFDAKNTWTAGVLINLYTKPLH